MSDPAAKLKLLTVLPVNPSSPPSHADYQGPHAGAEQAVLALLLAQPGVRGERGQGVHRVPLTGLRHHLRHHDGLGPGALLPAGAPRHGGEAGPGLDVLRGATHSGAAAAHADQVEPSWPTLKNITSVSPGV